MRWCFLPLLHALLVPTLTLSQPTASAGDRVRLTLVAIGDANPARPPMVVGTLDSIAHDTVYVDTRTQGHLAFHRRSLVRLERSRTGKRGISTGGGVLLGLLAGGAVGALLGASEPGDIEPGAASTIAGVAFAIPAALLGGIIGAVARERWETIPLAAP